MARTSKEVRVVIASISFLILAISVFSLLLSVFCLEAYHFYQFIFPPKNQLFAFDFSSVSNLIDFCFLVIFSSTSFDFILLFFKIFLYRFRLFETAPLC